MLSMLRFGAAILIVVPMPVVPALRASGLLGDILPPSLAYVVLAGVLAGVARWKPESRVTASWPTSVRPWKTPGSSARRLSAGAEYQPVVDISV